MDSKQRLNFLTDQLLLLGYHPSKILKMMAKHFENPKHDLDSVVNYLEKQLQNGKSSKISPPKSP